MQSRELRADRAAELCDSTWPAGARDRKEHIVRWGEVSARVPARNAGDYSQSSLLVTSSSGVCLSVSICCSNSDWSWRVGGGEASRHLLLQHSEIVKISGGGGGGAADWIISTPWCLIWSKDLTPFFPPDHWSPQMFISNLNYEHWTTLSKYDVVSYTIHSKRTSRVIWTPPCLWIFSS